MINVGHSPALLRNISLWLWHEADLSRKDVEEILEAKGVKINRTTMYTWLNDGDKAHWQAWQEIVKGLDDILQERGMSVATFSFDPAYTPNNLQALREASNMSEDDFAAVIGIKPRKLVIYESSSSINKKGLSFNQYNEIIKKLGN